MELWITHLCSAQTKVTNREVAAHTMWLKVFPLSLLFF